MSMVLPKLWSESSNYILESTKAHLNKYKQLIIWKEEESILEFGFADGNNSAQSLTPLLPNDYKEFVATDISEKMVAYAKKQCKIPKAKILQMDIASTIPIDFNKRFDHVFGFVVIHLVKNPRLAFKNIFNMLKPGGTAFITFFEQIPCDDMFHRLTQHPKWGKYGQDQMISPYYYSKDRQAAYKQDLEEAGFKNYVFGVEKRSYVFSSEEELNNILTSVNVTIPNIPNEFYEEYIKEYLQEKERGEMFTIITNENGKKTYILNYTFFVVVATKQ